MSEDPRVSQLVRCAAPPKQTILAAVGRCDNTGRKHTYTAVAGGTQKQHVGLLLGICTNRCGSRCDGHLKPLSIQMSLANRLGLLLELSTLDPPPFQSETFARWCCDTVVSLLSRDSQAQTTMPELSPRMFLAFTPCLPGMDDLPHLELDFLRRPYRTIARSNATVVTPHGEDVDVLVVIYQMDGIGPMRVVAKGKKLGALVGFTFRQPAILQALGLPHNSRQLGSYLMYEPFQQAWTQSVKPSQTITLGAGGGVIYRHPRVRVTLWLDHYVSEIYPNWARRGSSLHNLVTHAGSGQQVSGSASKIAASSGSSKSVTLKARPSPGSLATASSKAAAAWGSLKTASSNTATSSGSSKSSVSKPTTVIDLTGTTPPAKSRKRKRHLGFPCQYVELNGEEGGRQARRKRARTVSGPVKVEGKGTAADPYLILSVLMDTEAVPAIEWSDPGQKWEVNYYPIHMPPLYHRDFVNYRSQLQDDRDAGLWGPHLTFGRWMAARRYLADMYVGTPAPRYPPRRPILHWQNFPAAHAFLLRFLERYEGCLDARERHIFVWHVSNEFLMNGYMEEFEEEGFAAGDVRRAIPAWFRNMKRYHCAY
uniref:Cytochrome P450 monooxygenase CYP52X1 n=1 Tax=Ganoderma boninense TaxID=34458 RepID=A0A5K1JWA6_9APHY|nr:Cytochrome P450 monooxygenase CYP52X1 [Ganoderma boninense]